MMLSLDTAYRSFGGEVEASNTPTICRLPDSRRHQLSAIAPTTTTQTQSLPEQATGPGVPVVAPPNAKVGAALQRGQERQSELRSGQNTEASTAHQRIGYEVERPARIGVMRALNRHLERVFNDRSSGN